MEIILISVIWYVIGCVSFVYWWTKKHDFKTSDLIVMFLVGIIGIFSFIVGWMYFSETLNKVLIKKRENELD